MVVVWTNVMAFDVLCGDLAPYTKDEKYTYIEEWELLEKDERRIREIWVEYF